MTARVFFQAGPFAVTLYGLACAAALLALIWISRIMRGYSKAFPKKCLTAYYLAALPPALLCSRAAYCLGNLYEFSGRALAVFAVWQGGGVLTAALVGFVLAARASAAVQKISYASLLDALTPGLLVFVCLLRLFEGAPGKPATTGLFMSPLFSARDAYGVSRHAVSGYEAVLAACLLAAFIVSFRKARDAGKTVPPGEGFARAATLYCALMIPLESLRDGAYARIGDIRLETALCAAALLILIVVSAARLLRAGAAKQYVLVRALLALGALAWVVHIDFRAYCAGNLELNALWMALLAALSAACALSMRAARVRRLEKRNIA